MQSLFDRNGALLQALTQGYLLMSRTVITATGATTYTPPTGCRAMLVELIGGGAGGNDAANSSAGQIVLGGGGVSGCYATALIVTQWPNYTVTVGVGGSIAGTGGGGNPSNIVRGNLTLINASAGNSVGGTLATGTTEAFVAPTNITTSGADVSELKQVASASKALHRVSGTVAISGRGAPGVFGGHAQAAIAQAATAPSGKNYGAGGTGGISVNAGGASTGGTGGQGVAIIWELA